MNKFNFFVFLVVICLVISISVIGVMMIKSEYKLVKDVFFVMYKMDKVVCVIMKGNVEDICIVEVKGCEKVVKSEFEVNYSLFKKYSIDVCFVKVDVNYVVVKEKCDDLVGNVKDVCFKEVKVVYVMVKVDVNFVEKIVDVNMVVCEKISDVNVKVSEMKMDVCKDVSVEKCDVEYVVVKEKCDVLVGDVKVVCIKDVKVCFGQF